MTQGSAHSVALALVAIAATTALAADEDASDLETEIVVVARRFGSDAGTTVPSVTVIGPKTLERRQSTHVHDALQEVPGVQIRQGGPLGQATQMHVRGAGTNQTLVLVDGIPQNDATLGGGFDFNDLTTHGVERIEVLRGSYGVLYGTEAIGGVVSVTTRRGAGPLSGFARVEGGSFDTHGESFGLSAGEEGHDWALTLGSLRTHGERARESYRVRDAVLSFGIDAFEDLELTGTFRIADSETESPFDFATTGVLPEDANIGRDRRTISTGLTAVWDATDWLAVRTQVSLLDVDSTFENGPDGVDVVDPDFVPGSGDEIRVVRNEFVSKNTSEDVRLRVEGTVAVGRLLGLRDDTGDGTGDGTAVEVTLGGERLDQDTLSKSTFPDFTTPTSSTQRDHHDTDNEAVFALVEVRPADVAVFDDPVLSFGARNDDHSVFGDETSRFAGARAGVGDHGTIVRASYGEGYRAPKPGELFDPFVGDATLRPETSESVDIGVEQPVLDDGLVVGATWFRLRTDDLIAFDPTIATPARPFGALANALRTETEGVEWSAAADLGGGFRARGTYTRQRPDDKTTGADLFNRARSFGSAGVSWSGGDLDVSLDGVFSGHFHGQSGAVTYPEPSPRRHVGRQALVTLTARWRASETLTLFGRIDNLLDDDFVTSPTAPAGAPLGVFVGAQLDF